jgi:hypothetical protein
MSISLLAEQLDRSIEIGVGVPALAQWSDDAPGAQLFEEVLPVAQTEVAHGFGFGAGHGISHAATFSRMKRFPAVTPQRDHPAHWKQ